MFDLIKTDSSSNARRGRLRTSHGDIETPQYMPVGELRCLLHQWNRDFHNAVLLSKILPECGESLASLGET